MPKDNFYLSHLKNSEEDINNGFIDGIQSLRDTSDQLWEEIQKAINKLNITPEMKKSLLDLIGLYPQNMNDCLDFWERCNKLRHEETLASNSSLSAEAQKELSLAFMKKYNPSFSQ